MHNFTANSEILKPKRKNNIGKRNKLLFYIAVMALPCLQFVIFWVCVNINSILLAFRDYHQNTNSFTFYGFNNFKNVISDLKNVEHLIPAIKNSAIVYVCGILISTPLSVIFSYYLYKKKLMHKTFKTILFLPHILSALVVVLLYKYFVDRAIPGIYLALTGKTMKGLLANMNTAFQTIIFFGIWTGFGTSSMMYLGTMNGISDSVVEAAKLDGITPIKELWYITLPLIWPTFVTFLVVGFTGLFTNQANLYNFHGDEAPYQFYTFGYYLYVETQRASMDNYPYLAATGLCITAIVAPITVLLRKALERFGPSTI
ncbi:MAG: sugar ABC transporter permease [Clostridia bacterium]|nr:sugar ABC transporter permease [Clostridia bacterium]